MFRAYKFRLWTNANQERELGIMLETHRRLYNAALGQRQWFYDEWQISRSYEDQSGWFKDEREDNRWFAAINFSSAQATLRRLDKAFANFFRRVKAGEEPGYPRFKSADRFNSILYPSHGDGIRLKGNKLRVHHVGTIRVCLHREVEGKIKTLSMKREADKWFLVVASDVGEPAHSWERPSGSRNRRRADALRYDSRTEKRSRTRDTSKEELPELRRAQRSRLQEEERRKQPGRRRNAVSPGFMLGWRIFDASTNTKFRMI